ncbi:MAG: hypothetical protein IT340_02660 [Chloroflexi bacterium]|nr:hypothetical protein [Chloroflexota bacterium]
MMQHASATTRTSGTIVAGPDTGARREPALLTRHARQRAGERRVPLDMVDLIAQHGRKLHAAGAVHCFWGRREAAQYRGRLGPASDYLNGAVVVLSADGAVITTYRNKAAVKHLRRKGERAAHTAAARR